MQKSNRPRLGKVKNCMFGLSELHFKKTNVFPLSPIETVNREFMGGFCAHLAKMHPLWTITGNRPECRHRFVIIVQNIEYNNTL